MPDEYQSFRVGVNTFVVRDNRLLLGKRKNVYRSGTWALPGGHLEPGERLEDAAARELLEETGLVGKEWMFANIVNDRRSTQHYIQIGFVAQHTIGEPFVCEPDRCEAWKWFSLDALPSEIFPPHIVQIQLFREKKTLGDD
ncbi:TPA: hypothetical protein DEB00_01075 [Candidatus Uhrbacteria bacterium]|nr:hypothetical protein [Candidatus Uhrbacteria bacterium]